MPVATLSGWSEAEIIAEIAGIFPHSRSLKNHKQICLGIGDDAALLQLKPEQQLVVTTDSAVEGEDFDFRCFPEDAVGYRAMQQNLSDLAAMGAVPLAMLLNIAAAQQTPRARLKKILSGMAQAAFAANCPVVGGDLSSTRGPMNLSLTLLGTVRQGQALRRSGATPGEDLWLSGDVGAASCGLDALLKRRRAAASTQALLKSLCGDRRAHYQKFLRPQARLVLGQFLRGRASACIDLSDGLLVDAQRLAVASGVALNIEEKKLPRVPGVSIQKALLGGEDFELLFCAAADLRPALRRWSRRHSALLTKIGEVRPGQGLFVDDRAVDTAAGFDHFS